MEEPVHLYVVGTAGSGKSRFTWALDRWFDERGLDATTVNMDPGAEALAYQPDVDVRDWVSLGEVMERYGLGPNGAQVMAADLIAIQAGEIKGVLDGFRPHWFVHDTPGQTELFVFRESGRILMDVLGRERAIIVFLIDPYLARRPSAFVSQLLLSATTQFRFQLPVINVLTKTDLVKAEDVERILAWGEDPDRLMTDLFDEQADLINQLNTDVFRAIQGMSVHQKLLPVSAETLEGIEDVYARVQELYGAGEDLLAD